MSGWSDAWYGAHSFDSSAVHVPGDVSSQVASAASSGRMTGCRSCSQLNSLLASVVTIENVHSGSVLPA